MLGFGVEIFLLELLWFLRKPLKKIQHNKLLI